MFTYCGSANTYDSRITDFGSTTFHVGESALTHQEEIHLRRLTCGAFDIKDTRKYCGTLLTLDAPVTPVNDSPEALKIRAVYYIGTLAGKASCGHSRPRCGIGVCHDSHDIKCNTLEKRKRLSC